MSNLNKAFIKAYEKSATATPARTKAAPAGAASVVPGPHFAPGAQQPSAAKAAAPAVDDGPRLKAIVSRSASLAASATADVAAPTVPLTEIVPPPMAATSYATRTNIERAHLGVRPPHANFAEPAPRPLPTESPAVAATIAPAPKAPAAEPVAGGNDTPPINPRPVILPMTGPTPIWRPVFEVNSFTWPELTEVLLHAAAVQFRAAATDLSEACRRHRKLVAVTAAHRGEGCTVVTLALAKALTELQQRVIVVDANFDTPGIADKLGISAQVGWEDSLAGDKPLTEALVESLEERLIVLPLRQAAEMDWRMSVARLKSSFDELRRHCDVVLIDAGTLGELGDRRHLLSWAAPCRVDRALIVRDLRKTSDDEALQIEQRLHGCGIAQWNFVENFAAA